MKDYTMNYALLHTGETELRSSHSNQQIGAVEWQVYYFLQRRCFLLA